MRVYFVEIRNQVEQLLIRLIFVVVCTDRDAIIDLEGERKDRIVNDHNVFELAVANYS